MSAGSRQAQHAGHPRASACSGPTVSLGSSWLKRPLLVSKRTPTQSQRWAQRCPQDSGPKPRPDRERPRPAPPHPGQFLLVRLGRPLLGVPWLLVVEDGLGLLILRLTVRERLIDPGVQVQAAGHSEITRWLQPACLALGAAVPLETRT